MTPQDVAQRFSDFRAGMRQALASDDATGWLIANAVAAQCGKLMYESRLTTDELYTWMPTMPIGMVKSGDELPEGITPDTELSDCDIHSPFSDEAFYIQYWSISFPYLSAIYAGDANPLAYEWHWVEAGEAPTIPVWDRLPKNKWRAVAFRCIPAFGGISEKIPTFFQLGFRRDQYGPDSGYTRRVISVPSGIDSEGVLLELAFSRRGRSDPSLVKLLAASELEQLSTYLQYADSCPMMFFTPWNDPSASDDANPAHVSFNLAWIADSIRAIRPSLDSTNAATATLLLQRLSLRVLPGAALVGAAETPAERDKLAEAVVSQLIDGIRPAVAVLSSAIRSCNRGGDSQHPADSFPQLDAVLSLRGRQVFYQQNPDLSFHFLEDEEKKVCDELCAAGIEYTGDPVEWLRSLWGHREVDRRYRELLDSSNIPIDENELLPQNTEGIAQPAREPQDGGWTGSERADAYEFDFENRTLVCGRNTYTLTSRRAAFVGVLFEAWERRRPDVTEQTIRDAVWNGNGPRDLGEAFRLPSGKGLKGADRYHAVWREVIIKGTLKDSYRLRMPENVSQKKI